MSKDDPFLKKRFDDDMDKEIESFFADGGNIKSIEKDDELEFPLAHASASSVPLKKRTRDDGFFDSESGHIKPFLFISDSVASQGPTKEPRLLPKEPKLEDEDVSKRRRFVEFFVSMSNKGKGKKNYSRSDVRAILSRNNYKIKSLLIGSKDQAFTFDFQAFKLQNVIARIEDCDEVVGYLTNPENFEKFDLLKKNFSSNDLGDLLSRLNNNEKLAKKVEYLCENHREIIELLELIGSKKAISPVLRVATKSTFELDETFEFIRASQRELYEKIPQCFSEETASQSTSRLENERMFFWNLLSCCDPNFSSGKAHDYNYYKDFIIENFGLIFNIICTSDVKFSSNQKQSINSKDVAFIISNYTKDEAREILLKINSKIDEFAVGRKERKIYDRIFDLRFAKFADMLNSPDGDKSLEKLIKICQGIELKFPIQNESIIYDKIFELAVDRDLDAHKPNFLDDVALRFSSCGLSKIKFSLKKQEYSPSTAMVVSSIRSTGQPISNPRDMS